MRLPKTATKLLSKKMTNLTIKRKPDYIIGEPNNPYLKRWWVIPRNRIFNIYLHLIIRSDDDRALHDHPFPNISILLKNGYIEHTIAQGGVHYKVNREVGDIVFRRATKAHRLEVLPFADEPAMSLFITGPRIREWYFHCVDKGKIWWQDFVSTTNSGQVGRGCGD
jgi:hypothetical protein